LKGEKFMQILVDRRDIDFVLYEQFNAESLFGGLYEGVNKTIVKLVIDEVFKQSKNMILPTQFDGDTIGCKFENGKVKVPDSYHDAYQLLCDTGWMVSSENPDFGGEGLPHIVNCVITEILTATNMAFLTIGLTKGSARLIERFGTKEQKDFFLKKMYAGEWGGTMVLTESEAGTDVGAIEASAKKIEDNLYSITGNKIFITCGEHNLTENIVHLVLARGEGAPRGPKGISLFIVPKIWVNEDGSLGKPNDVLCTGIEEKMGLHGSPTCSLSFGSKGKCRGLLLGEENKGLKYMFTMMNEARFLVGLQGLAQASAAYIYAVNYARERKQGKDLLETFNELAPSVPIIEHPDVKRMLLEMKVYVEGMRSIFYHVAWLNDKFLIENEKGHTENAKTYKTGIDLLTPIAKGYATDKACQVCDLAVQVYGGYGYIKDYPVEQLLRDVRITRIYEGTNGIQAMDLLARKIDLIPALVNKIRLFIECEQKNTPIFNHLKKLKKAVDKLEYIAEFLSKKSFSAEAKSAFAHAYPFLEVTGDVVMAWMLLWRASIASKKLHLFDGRGVKKRDNDFYKGQMKSAKYFMKKIFPLTVAKMDTIVNIEDGDYAEVDDIVSSMSDKYFGVK